MKKIGSYAVLLLVALTTVVTFSSCRDENIAYTLEGTWKGSMYIRRSSYTSTTSEIEFIRNSAGATSGTGYWIDYYDNVSWRYSYVLNHIRWTVNEGRIAVNFVDEGTTVYIENYSLGNNTFTGEIYDNGNYVPFTLYKTSSPNWSSYQYYSDEYYDYNYSKPNSSVIDFDSRSGASDSTKVQK